LEEQGEARVSSQPAPEWTAQDEEHVWNIVRAALIDGLDHPGVGLGPNRVVAGLMELESYERRGDSYKDDEQLDEELYDIGAVWETSAPEQGASRSP
jgi:hypothetical protein